jgi:DNA polymerase elongation subunit (family B)
MVGPKRGSACPGVRSIWRMRALNGTSRAPWCTPMRHENAKGVLEHNVPFASQYLVRPALQPYCYMTSKYYNELQTSGI